MINNSGSAQQEISPQQLVYCVPFETKAAAFEAMTHSLIASDEAIESLRAKSR